MRYREAGGRRGRQRERSSPRRVGLDGADAFADKVENDKKAGVRFDSARGLVVQRFLDYADDQVERAVRAKRKGALAAYRDATLFKVIYGWGLRRTETSKLDVVDFGRNPKAPQFGRYGTLNVRYGKAKKGQPPRRRTCCR